MPINHVIALTHFCSILTHNYGISLPVFFLSLPPATWVRRPYEEDDAEQLPEGKSYLSDFQVEKFTYYFTDVFDHNKDRVITIEDIQALNEVSLGCVSHHLLPINDISSVLICCGK